MATDDPPQKDYPKLSSTVNVFVHVADRDDVPGPTNSARMRVVVNAVNGKFVGGRVAKTYFKDTDGDGDSSAMTYSLTGTV
jgi:hypothetical protein